MKISDVKDIYHQNKYLIIIFIGLISFTFILALFLAFDFTKRFVYGKFDSEKVYVLDATISPYFNFIERETTEFDFDKGDTTQKNLSLSASQLFNKYSFIKDIAYFRIEPFNESDDYIYDYKRGNYVISIEKLYSFERSGTRKDSVAVLSGKQAFENRELKKRFIFTMDQFVSINEDISDTTSSNYPIVWMNNMRMISNSFVACFNLQDAQQVSLYQKLFEHNYQVYNNIQYEPLELTFFELNPMYFKIINTNSGLYQKIIIRPLYFDTLTNKGNDIYKTSMPLPGAFSGYKLLFISDKNHIELEIFKAFLPFAFSFVVVYCLVLVIAFLIFSNMTISHKMFKLQYDFINNLTHEFKTPVSVIKIAGDNIRSVESLTDRERKYYGKILNEEADKLNNLLTRLLSFSQLESKSITLKRSKVRLREFCDNIISSYSLKYPAFNISCDVADNECIETDKMLLNSLFTNLIDNAYKYSNDDRKELNISIFEYENNITFLFIDKGIGISQLELLNVFKKFYKVDNEFNKNGSVGIGLTFCKEIVLTMGGEISVTSEMNIGSEFKIVLPKKLSNNEY